MPVVTLDSLDLAALLCSRVCHDVISPVGAIVNGLELLEEEKDPEMREEAIGLIKRSAGTASAKLQYCRLAFGAAGSAGASIDTGDAEQVARNLLADNRTRVHWNAARLLLPKNTVKILLNMCLIAAATIPRGGELTVTIDGTEKEARLKVEASGKTVRLAHGVENHLRGESESDTIDAHGIQAYYTGLVARTSGMEIGISASAEAMSMTCVPAAARMQGETLDGNQNQSAA